MQCCVPFCKRTSDNVSTSDGEGKAISFHGFPREMHLRTAWLRALGKQDDLPDSAVVCSQHFLSDDIYETESGSRQICAGAIPSTVQVCMICLDTDSKLLLMSKLKLDEAYEKLTGEPLCDQGKLKQTLCIQCAQRLINFSRFRDKSLRARALMMDLVEKHESITRHHITMINRTKHQLTSNMVVTSLGPDHCDLHILEHLSEDNQEESEESRLEGIMKIEGNNESTSADEDMEMENEDDKNFIDFVENPVKYESDPFQCACCWEEFVHEHAYMQHMSKHVQQGDGDGECETSQVCKPHTAVSSSSAHSALSTENKQADFSPSAHSTQTLVAPLPASLATNNEIQVPPTEEADTNVSCRYNRLTDCFVKLYDVFSKKVVPRQDGKAVRFCVSQNIASKDTSSQATSENEVSTTEYVGPVTNKVKVIESKTLQNKTDCLKNVIDIQCLLQSSSHTEGKCFICDICRKLFKRKSLLVKHIKTHAEVRWLTCKICQYKCKYQSHLKRHMRTHTGDKPYSCKICEYKCSQRSSIITHMRTHTGEKPYSCKICEYKCAHRTSLMQHMRTHTGIKNFSCKLCNYKSAQNGTLVRHMRTHTGEKPYSCKICEYKCAHSTCLKNVIDIQSSLQSSSHTEGKCFICDICRKLFKQKCLLVKHIKTHAEVRWLTCKICQYKYKYQSDLKRHMRTHTGDKPYSCEICEYKCSQRSSIITHMRTHTGEKPYSCKICEYKCAHRTSLMQHMSIHTGIKNFSCMLCNYKCVQNGTLVTHMRTHTGDQPYSCEICEYKCSQSSNLIQHMRIHTGIKNYLCKLCDYKCAQNSTLVTHMRTHTGEKPYSCNICEYKCSRSSNLMKHIMRAHTAAGETPSSSS